MESRPVTLALVAAGGVLGACCRYALATVLPTSFPFGTLVANVLGAFALGVLLYERRVQSRLSSRTRLVAGTGFLSSFTTYSTFAAETIALTPRLAAVNVVANYALGLLAVIAGRTVIRWRA